MSSRIFVSAASKEFRSLRERLAASLQQAGFEIEHQNIFPQTSADTVRTLADLLKDCCLVIHLVNHQLGSVANELALTDLLHSIPAEDFLPKHPELRKALGDLSGITYTQWEAFFALHFGVPKFLYHTAEHFLGREDELKLLDSNWDEA